MRSQIHCDVAIAGAGIMGLSCALELARAGAKVVVLDPHAAGTKASWAAAGILATRGARRAQSPFRRFYLQSIARYPSWLDGVQADGGMAIPYARGGDYLIFDRSRPEGEKAHAETVARLRREEALPWHEEKKLPAFLQSFSRPGDFIAMHFEQEAYVNNRILLEGLIAACFRRGVSLLTGGYRSVSPTPVQHASQGIWEIPTEDHALHARHVLITAGAWSQAWLSAMGWQSDLIPVKGQVALIKRPWSDASMVHLQEDLYLIPRGDSLIIGATTEPKVWDEGFNDFGRDELRNRLETFFPELPFAPLESWSGLRPRTRDRLPLMGRVPENENAWLCAGHYKCGISMAPLAARCMSDLILGHRPPMDIEAFDPGRKSALKPLPQPQK